MTAPDTASEAPVQRMTISLGEKIIAQYTGIDKELLVPRELDAASWERARKGDRIVVVLYPDLTQGGADAADSFSMFALWGTEAVKYTQHDGDVPRVYRLSYASTLYGGVIGAGAKKLGQPTLAVLHVQVNGHGTKIGTLSLYDPANCSGLQAKDLSEAEAQSWMNARGFVLPPNANNKVVAWAGVPQLELATAKPAGVQHGFVQRP